MRILVAALVTIALLAGCSSHRPAPAPVAAPAPPANPAGVSVAKGTPLPAEFQAGFQGISVDTGFPGGEPNIGITSPGNVFVTTVQQSGGSAPNAPHVARSTDGGKSWSLLDMPLGAPTTLDPMLWVDPVTDRIFANQLYVGCSYLSYSDDEGATWSESPISCGTPIIDHQKVATGPYPAGAPQAAVGGAIYPTLASYCYNKLAGTHCAVSFDGGIHYEYDTLIDTSPEAAQVDTQFSCGGLSGHQHHAADGTIYLPYGFNCGQAFIATSTDGGITWTRHRTGLSSLYVDSDITSTPDGMVYYFGKDATQTVYMIRSKDHFDTFEGPFKVSPPEVTGTEFTVMNAGSDGRVAFAYLGNSQNTNNSIEDDMPPYTVWNLYITMTLDGESANPTFVTTQVNPKGDPVQRGSICMARPRGGCDPDDPNDPGSTDNRNLLDFIDAAVGPDGRFWVVYTDGCTSKECMKPGQKDVTTSRDQHISVAHLTVGPSLYADKPAFVG